jgi:antitoxin (DNA-binding transcriptional repressor) of toxin-antitoxin stability system
MVRDATIRRAQDGPRSVVEQADEDIARIVAQARRER